MWSIGDNPKKNREILSTNVNRKRLDDPVKIAGLKLTMIELNYIIKDKNSKLLYQHTPNKF